MRLGYGEEKPNYSTTYRLVQEAIEGELIKEYSWLIKAHQLLRRHWTRACADARILTAKNALSRKNAPGQCLTNRGE